MTQAALLATAISQFVAGCKTDGIWDPIKACCIMAAWDGLAGALYPLKGPAPTNFNFVAGDYDRETGLVGDGSTKYLDSNRNNNADPQNSKHIACWASSLSTTTVSTYMNSSTGVASGRSHIVVGPSVGTLQFKANGDAAGANIISASTGFMGVTRSSSSSQLTRVGGNNATESLTSALLAQDEAIGIFARSTGTTPPGYGDARLAFYSIGESLDLALLDARVTTLITAIGAAIP